MHSGSIPGLATTQARDRPVLFLIDDDAGVVRALRDDLSRRFGQDFRVLGETSVTGGLETLRDLAGRHERVALLIVDHHMREMAGVGFLARAHEMHPLAKRVLLVERDYSACSPVVQAMTLGQADYHFTKPWMLEQDLYCVISEFLAEWAKDQEAGFDLFHVIGGQQDPGTSELRELLTRFNVPFHFHAADSEEARRLLRNRGLSAACLPVVIRHDDYTMVQPTRAQIVEAVGGSTRTDVAACDVVIAGAGPAGLAAAVYAASEGLQTVVLEETVSGGQAGSSPMIRNYPGFAHGISGHELTRRPGRAAPGAACPAGDDPGAGRQPGALDVGLPDPRDRGHGQRHRAPAYRDHRRPRSPPPGGTHPARQAAPPDSTGPGGRTLRADRRRAADAVAPSHGPAQGRIHPDRARRGADWGACFTLATRSRTSSAGDLHARRFRRRRRPLPFDQTGRVRSG